MKQTRYVQFAAFAATVAAYLAIRFWNLTAPCLWFDEIFSVHAAEHPWNSILNFVALDLIHPPLFYLLLKIWVGVGGEGLFWLRLLPVVFSIIAIFPFIALCREFKLNFWMQILALFFLAVNGSLIKYAQEVRMYSLLMCIALFSMWLFLRYFNRGKSFAGLVIVNILLVYTHYFGWFVIASEVTAILIFQQIKWRRIVLMFAIVFSSFLPWMIAVWQAARSGSELSQNIGWMSRPGLREIGVFVLDLIEPIYSQASSAEPASIYRVSMPIVLFAAISWSTYLLSWKCRTYGERRTIWLLLILFKMPVIFALIASWLLPYSIWGTRHLIIVFVPFSILLAIAVMEIRIVWLRTASITLLLVFGGYAAGLQIGQHEFQSWCGVEPLVAEALEAEGLNIYTTEDLFAYHAWFAGRRSLDENTKVLKINNVEGMTEDKAFFLPRGFGEIKTIDVPDIADKRFWLIYRRNSILDNEPPIRNFAVAGYHVKSKKFIGMRDAATVLLALEK